MGELANGGIWDGRLWYGVSSSTVVLFLYQPAQTACLKIKLSKTTTMTARYLVSNVVFSLSLIVCFNCRWRSWSVISWRQVYSTRGTCYTWPSSASCWWSSTRRPTSSSTSRSDAGSDASCEKRFASRSALVRRRRPWRTTRRRAEGLRERAVGRRMRPISSCSTITLTEQCSRRWLFDRWLHLDDSPTSRRCNLSPVRTSRLSGPPVRLG